MINMENNKENKKSFVKSFFALSLIPFVLIGIEAKNKYNSIAKGVLIGFLSFFITAIGWGIFYADSPSNEYTSNVSLIDNISNLHNKIDKKNIEIDELKDKIDKLESNIKVKESVKKEIVKVSVEPKVTAKKEIKKDYTFSSGNYYAGDDFESGTYTITAISGNGNVISDNMFDGGINAIMGTKAGMYEKEYKNIELPEGTKLEIKGLKVKLLKK